MKVLLCDDARAITFCKGLLGVWGSVVHLTNLVADWEIIASKVPLIRNLDSKRTREEASLNT